MATMESSQKDTTIQTERRRSNDSTRGFGLEPCHARGTVTAGSIARMAAKVLESTEAILVGGLAIDRGRAAVFTASSALSGSRRFRAALWITSNGGSGVEVLDQNHSSLGSGGH